MDVVRVFWFDESSVNCAMTRLYARAFSCERVCEYVPDVRFERVSVMGALGLEGVVAPFVFKGTLNGEVFGAYVREVLAPVLKAGDVFMLDNSSVHKVRGVLDPLLEKGVLGEFLPRYSPDFNPVEFVWSKVKAYLRKVKARAVDELKEMFSRALNTITVTDSEGWIKHCCYRL